MEDAAVSFVLLVRRLPLHMQRHQVLGESELEFYYAKHYELLPSGRLFHVPKSNTARTNSSQQHF